MTPVPDWSRILPDEDYRFRLGLRPGDAQSFFGFSPERPEILAERGRWLQAAPELYGALKPEGVDPLLELIQLLAGFGVREGDSTVESAADLPLACRLCQGLGAAWEPDFLLLRTNPTGQLQLVGGVVCFPSSWALTEKMGLSVSEIHGVVPELNPSLDTQIRSFLGRLAPGKLWERDNWGLSPDAELNRHPARGLPGLSASAALSTTWLRVEHQAFASLPDTQALLFAIRVTVHRLSDLAQDPLAARGLSRALSTMSEEIALYKGVAQARGSLTKELSGGAFEQP